MFLIAILLAAPLVCATIHHGVMQTDDDKWLWLSRRRRGEGSKNDIEHFRYLGCGGEYNQESLKILNHICYDCGHLFRDNHHQVYGKCSDECFTEIYFVSCSEVLLYGHEEYEESLENIVYQLNGVGNTSALSPDRNNNTIEHFHALGCKGDYDERLFKVLNNMCGGCGTYNRNDKLYNYCKEQCFTGIYSTGCRNVLYRDEKDEKLLKKTVYQLNGVTDTSTLSPDRTNNTIEHFYALGCEGDYDPEFFEKLNNICGGCGTFYRNEELYERCKEHCFKGTYFTKCTRGLSLMDEEDAGFITDVVNHMNGV